MAHQDVVPIEAGTESLWTVDPFAGEIKEGFIWGRGTTDDKINLISLLEAAEKLLQNNFQPEQTIYFSFVHDEEVSGTGAIAVAALLKERGVEAEFVMDEGGIITSNQIPGITKPIALLGTSEKGFLSIVLSVEKAGGHSSMPAPETAIDILTKAIVRLRAKPFEARFSESMSGFIESLGPEMPFVQRMAFANAWLFKGMIVSAYESSPGGNAMVRTTVAPTTAPTANTQWESIKSASERTGFSEWTLRQEINSGRLPAYRLSTKPGSRIRLKVADVATRLGFSDARAFRRAFRLWTGQSPDAYRAQLADHPA